MDKPRVMYILREYPQISQTYIKNEIDALRDDYEIMVIAEIGPDVPYKNHVPFRYMDNPAAMHEAVEEFRPHVLHSHWLFQAETLGKLAKKTNVPFTIRAHSFDAMAERKSLSNFINLLPGRNRIPSHLRKSVRLINDDLCLGILAYPFTRPMLEKAGIHNDKIFDCYPVINYQRFYDRSPNGEAIMNVGAAKRKKKMDDFIHLAKMVPNTEFNLYAMGFRVSRIDSLNKSMGNPVNVIPPIEPEDMAGEYKKHKWLVYTADRKIATVGWPMAVAEAQASGLGICVPNLRPDLKEYVGGAGFIYDQIGEVADIIKKPYPEEMRQIGFEQAEKSNISRHKVILTDLWQRAIGAIIEEKSLLRKSAERPEPTTHTTS